MQQSGRSDEQRQLQRPMQQLPPYAALAQEHLPADVTTAQAADRHAWPCQPATCTMDAAHAAAEVTAGIEYSTVDSTWSGDTSLQQRGFLSEQRQVQHLVQLQTQQQQVQAEQLPEPPGDLQSQHRAWQHDQQQQQQLAHQQSLMHGNPGLPQQLYQGLQLQPTGPGPGPGMDVTAAAGTEARAAAGLAGTTEVQRAAAPISSAMLASPASTTMPYSGCDIAVTRAAAEVCDDPTDFGAAEALVSLGSLAPASHNVSEQHGSLAATATDHGTYTIGPEVSASFYSGCGANEANTMYMVAAADVAGQLAAATAVGGGFQQYGASGRGRVDGQLKSDSNEYYQQKLNDILREAGRQHEIGLWRAVSKKRPSGKPDAYYVGPDGTRYKSRAILRDRLKLPPGPGARKAKVLQQQQLEAVIAANTATARQATGTAEEQAHPGSQLQLTDNTQAETQTQLMSSSSEPASLSAGADPQGPSVALNVSRPYTPAVGPAGTADAAARTRAGVAADTTAAESTQVPAGANLQDTGAVARPQDQTQQAPSGQSGQQAAAAEPAVATKPVHDAASFKERILQFVREVAVALAAAEETQRGPLRESLRGQYKVIHLLRCPLLTGMLVHYCRRTSKGVVRNDLLGIITADGNIKCGCNLCRWLAPIPNSMFEEHSGSTVRRPAQYTYVIGVLGAAYNVNDPKTLKNPKAMIASVSEPYNITLKEILVLVNSGTAPAPGTGTTVAAAGSSSGSGEAGCVFTATGHTRHCVQCNTLGSEAAPLLECAGCPLSYHNACLGIKGVVPANEDWYCSYCLHACREPDDYKDSMLHQLCQQAVISNRQLPRIGGGKQQQQQGQMQMLPQQQLQQRPGAAIPGMGVASDARLIAQQQRRGPPAYMAAAASAAPAAARAWQQQQQQPPPVQYPAASVGAATSMAVSALSSQTAVSLPLSHSVMLRGSHAAAAAATAATARYTGAMQAPQAAVTKAAPPAAAAAVQGFEADMQATVGAVAADLRPALGTPSAAAAQQTDAAAADANAQAEGAAAVTDAVRQPQAPAAQGPDHGMSMDQGQVTGRTDEVAVIVDGSAPSIPESSAPSTPMSASKAVSGAEAAALACADTTVPEAADTVEAWDDDSTAPLPEPLAGMTEYVHAAEQQEQSALDQAAAFGANDLEHSRTTLVSPDAAAPSTTAAGATDAGQQQQPFVAAAAGIAAVSPGRNQVNVSSNRPPGSLALPHVPSRATTPAAAALRGHASAEPAMSAPAIGVTGLSPVDAAVPTISRSVSAGAVSPSASSGGATAAAVVAAVEAASKAQLQRLQQLKMKRKRSLEQQDQVDPVVQKQRELAAAESLLRKLQLQQQAHECQRCNAAQEARVSEKQQQCASLQAAIETLGIEMQRKIEEHDRLIQMAEQIESGGDVAMGDIGLEGEDDTEMDNM